MALMKVRGWFITLVSMMILPILTRVHTALEKRASETPEEWDDVMAGAFKVVIDFLSSPDAFEET